MNNPLVEQIEVNQWQATCSDTIKQHAVTSLEKGKLLFLPQLPFTLSSEEQKFLSPVFLKRGGKNISYNLLNDELRGARVSSADLPTLQALMKRYAESAYQLLQQLLPGYLPHLIIGRTSLRPAEIRGRKSSIRKDDKRLHVDAFPATPNQGKRILRVFSNVNLYNADRVWHTGESFEEVAARYVPQIRKPLAYAPKLLKLLGITRSERTLYDHYMLHIHDRMKMDETYQKNVVKNELRLPPHTSWIVQTDHVSHAVVSGQHLMEQTFYLPVDAMQNPSLSPLRVLESMLGQHLV